MQNTPIFSCGKCHGQWSISNEVPMGHHALPCKADGSYHFVIVVPGFLVVFDAVVDKTRLEGNPTRQLLGRL